MPKPKPTTASTIPIHCSYARLADVTSLVSNPRNPNKHSDKQVALLAKVIRHQGWRAPITVSKRSGFIVTGHGRLAAALLLQVEQVPIDEQDFATEADEWAHLVADNRIAELADADRGMIADLLGELDAGGLDMDLTGFDMEALEEALAESDVPQQDDIYTNKIVAPIYEPKGEQPPISDLIDRSKTEELMKGIKAADLPNEVAEFLRFAAERHTTFHFRNIAEFYCHADKPTQDLMEKSALIIIDFDKAIENGFVHLTEKLRALADQENDEDEDDGE
jgi:ParB-like chromosome segregation protein Spo0J